MATHLVPSVTDAEARSALDAVVADLCRTKQVNGRTVIYLPVSTQSGGGVSVSVWLEPGGTYLVSDDGTAYHEISTAAASERLFARYAREACQRYGATFDGLSMLLMRVSVDQLEGAIIAMGSLIKEVVDRTVEQSYSAKIEGQRETFVRRISEVFSTGAVTENGAVDGYSTTRHHFDVVVKARGQLLAFDLFSAAPTSVSAAFLKLSDIAQLEQGPRPIGVTSSKSALGTKLALVASVASVIELGAPDRTIASLAA